MLTGHDDQVVALPEAQQCSSLLNIGDVLFLFHPVGDQIFSSCCKDSLSVICSPFPKNYKIELMFLFNFSKKLLKKVKVDFLSKISRS